jgi:formamidopyrimidine-DNA glycosylase
MEYDAGMPELPEVETVRMKLEPLLVGQTVTAIEPLHRKPLLGHPGIAVGKRILAVKRFGKMLLIDLEGETDIGVHLKMSGQLLFRKQGGPDTLPDKHTRVVIRFGSGDTLYFNDQRIFGWVQVMTAGELKQLAYLRTLGPEPWDVSDDGFYRKLHAAKRAVKLVILDQSVISGVGNIYANDGLWDAGIDPRKSACRLSGTEAACLRKSLVTVLRNGIRYGGSTGKDGKYLHPDGKTGKYQEHFLVYDRDGKPCPREDGGIIAKIQLGGRGTFLCPVCQD